MNQGSTCSSATQVYYNDIPVGTFCCRLEVDGDQAKLYVMTMGVLAVSIFCVHLRVTFYSSFVYR